MRTPASILGHPIHPMLVPLPIGLWIFSLVCDLIGASAARTRRKTAIAHMSINLAVVVLYVVNFWMRLNSPEKGGVAVEPVAPSGK